MAMNKKEQAEFEKAKHDAVYLPKLAKALRWTDEKPEKDLAIPTSGYTVGWDYHCSVYDGVSVRVSQKWSECSRHGAGDGTTRNHGSQNGIKLYPTKILALKALRSEMELAFAEELLKIDNQIERDTMK
jgi:hypothetical protein